MMKTTSRISLFVVGMVLVAWIAACSDSDSPTGPGAGDTTAPTVLLVDPGQDDTGVPLGDELVVTFNEPMTASTDVADVTLSSGTVTALNWTSDTMLRVSHSAWANGTNVQATLATAFSDTSGNGLATPYTWDFWTVTATPQVLDASVAEGATGVSRNASISFLFSAEMNLSSLDAATTLTNNQAVPKRGVGFQWVSGEGTRVNLTFSPTLDANTNYTVDIAASAQTAAGPPLGAAFQLNFTTGMEADTTPPTLVSIVPSNGSTISTSTSSLVMTFSEAVDQGRFDPTMISAQFDDLFGAAGVDVVWSTDGTQLTVPLPTPLPDGLPIAVRFDQFFDLAGNEQTTPIDYKVIVAGTAELWPAPGSEAQFWFESWSDMPTGGQPDFGSGNLYRRYESVGANEFLMADYDDPGLTMRQSSDRFRRLSNVVQLVGFSDYDLGVELVTTISPPIEYMRLPPTVTMWTGSATATDPDGPVDVSYTIRVLGQEDLEADLLLKAPSFGPSRRYVDTWKATLEFEIREQGTGTLFSSGVDTLWFAPVTGFVQRSSRETSMDGVFDSFEKYVGPLSQQF